MKSIRIAFTNRDIIGSHLIREFSDADLPHEKTPSHIAWVFFDKFVIESTFPLGMSIGYFKSFKKKNNIVRMYKYNIELPGREVADRMEAILSKYDGMGYDTMGILYQAAYLIYYKLFDKKMHYKNIWESKERVSCQEIFEEHFGMDTSLDTPYDLMKKIEGHFDWDEDYI